MALQPDPDVDLDVEEAFWMLQIPTGPEWQDWNYHPQCWCPLEPMNSSPHYDNKREIRRPIHIGFRSFQINVYAPTAVHPYEWPGSPRGVIEQPES